MRRQAVWFVFVLLGLARAEDASKVKFLRVPEEAVQPQVVVSQGKVHMIHFLGDASAGDVYYVRSEDGGATFTRALRVNSRPGSAVAVGNVRGARMAVGRNGRVHVAWNGSQKAETRSPSGAPPMLYARLNDAGTAFEPQRNLIQSAWGIDGGGSVAADRAGNVYVFWHAPEPGRRGEENRRVWLARSADDGKTFDREKPVWDRPTGACGCCGLDAFASSKGLLYVLYRSATEMVHRDMHLLVSRNRGENFEASGVHPWNVGYCVMSTEAFYEDPNGVLAAWETERQVYYARLDPATGKMSQPVAAPGGTGERKHPAVAGNTQSETFLVWTEGMSWKKGGSVAWQLFDKAGKPTHEHGHADGVPMWSLVSTFARADGGFMVVY